MAGAALPARCFEALLTTARLSANRNDFALIGMLGLLAARGTRRCWFRCLLRLSMPLPAATTGRSCATDSAGGWIGTPRLGGSSSCPRQPGSGSRGCIPVARARFSHGRDSRDVAGDGLSLKHRIGCTSTTVSWTRLHSPALSNSPTTNQLMLFNYPLVGIPPLTVSFARADAYSSRGHPQCIPHTQRHVRHHVLDAGVSLRDVHIAARTTPRRP